MSETAPLVPANAARAELTVRKSRFIGHAEHAASRPQALAVVERVQAAFPDARHHCWAYWVGDPRGTASAAMSDAGEPSGTAGRPILGVIQHKGIADVVVVVVRYFGGIKLGAGGLTRAYAAATEQVLASLELERYSPRARRALALAFSMEQPLRHWAASHEAKLEAVTYGEGVRVVVSLPESRLPELTTFCGSHGIPMETVSPAGEP